ncbi:MAG TPA: hypothetical protein VF457_09680 [Burkholderiaceae bacterium]
MPLDIDLQRLLFEAVLDELDADGGDLVNKAVDVFHKMDGSVEYEVYEIPASSRPLTASTALPE